MQLLLARLRTVEEKASAQLLPLGIQLQLEQQGDPTSADCGSSNGPFVGSAENIVF
jgi:hypothetical protein